MCTCVCTHLWVGIILGGFVLFAVSQTSLVFSTCYTACWKSCRLVEVGGGRGGGAEDRRLKVGGGLKTGD